MSDTCPKCHRPRLDAEHAHARASELSRVDVCLLEGAPLCAVAAHAYVMGLHAEVPRIDALRELVAITEEQRDAARAKARAMHRRAQAAESRRPFSQYVHLGDDELAKACGYVVVTFGGPEECHAGCGRKATRMYQSGRFHSPGHHFDGCGRCLRARLMRRGAYSSRGGVDERARRNMDLGAAVRSASSSLDIGEIDAVTHYSMHLEKGSLQLTALRHPGAQLAILRMVAHMRLSQAGPAERAKYEADKAAWIARVEKNAPKGKDG